MSMIERLKDVYSRHFDKQLLKEMDDDYSFMIRMGFVTEEKIEDLTPTPEFQSLYHEIKESGQDPEGVIEYQGRPRMLHWTEQGAINRLMAEELRSKLDL